MDIEIEPIKGQVEIPAHPKLGHPLFPYFLQLLSCSVESANLIRVGSPHLHAPHPSQGNNVFSLPIDCWA